MYIHNEKIPVRYCETDKMGIVHHSNYARYMEQARVNFLNSIGVNFFEFEQRGFVSPVLSLEIKFKHSAIFGDILNVECKIQSFNGVRLFFEYVIINQKGDVVITAVSSHAFTTDKLVPVRLKNATPDYYEYILKASE